MIISHFPCGGSGGGLPQFAYSGEFAIETQPEGWKIRFLTSGTLTMYQNATVDIFLVGGGGSGSGIYKSQNMIDTRTQERSTRYFYGGGGAGGYTNTQQHISLTSGKLYTIVVGGSDQASSITPVDTTEWSGQSYSANAGSNGPGSATNGAAGGSGGGAPCHVSIKAGTDNVRVGGSFSINGGTNGGNGSGSNTYNPSNGAALTLSGGQGQGTTTREFGETTGTLYASGGKACYTGYGSEPAANTGNGGDSGYDGASGIIIIRNTR